MQNELLHVSQLQRGKSPVTLCQSCHKLREIVCPLSLSLYLPPSVCLYMCVGGCVCVLEWGVAGGRVCCRCKLAAQSASCQRRRLFTSRTGFPFYLPRCHSLYPCPSPSQSLCCPLSPFLPLSLSFICSNPRALKPAPLKALKKSSAEPKWGNGKGKRHRHGKG